MRKQISKSVNQRPDIMTDGERKDFVEDLADGHYDCVRR